MIEPSQQPQRTPKTSGGQPCASSTYNTPGMNHFETPPFAALRNMQTKLSQKIHFLREQKVLSQKELANDCTINPTDLVKLEAGELDVSLSVLVLHCEASGPHSRESLMEGI